MADGELVAEKETGRLKIGDGVTRYNLLPFVNPDATRDKIESKLYDPAYSWELVPGSDVPATALDGIGQLALTDENAGGLIGDIAYVVSGWVWNAGVVSFTAYPEDWAGVQFLGVGSHAVNVGDKFTTAVADPNFPDRSIYNTVTVAGTVIVTSPYWSWQGPSYGSTTTTWVGGSYWPYIERFDLKNKTWLPRIPLPTMNVLVSGVAAIRLMPPALGNFYLPDVRVCDNGGGITSGGAFGFPALPQLPKMGPYDVFFGAGDYPNPLSPQEGLASSFGPGAGTSDVNFNTELVVIVGDGPGPTSDQINAWFLAFKALVQASSHPTFLDDVPLAPWSNWADATADSHIDVIYASEGGIAGVIDGKLYFGGGDGDDITGQEFFVFDPSDESITRLADMPDNYPDYAPYGVVGGKLWYFTGGKAVSYTPSTNTWVEQDYTFGDGGDGLDGYDQVAGYEWKDKLLFVLYEDAYIFDPTTLDMQHSGAPDGFSLMGSFFVNGQVECYEWDDNPLRPGVAFSKTGRKAIYDPDANTWTEKTDALNYLVSGATELVSVTYKNTPYVLSKVGLNTTVRGVYGRTGKSLVKPYLPLQEREVTAAQIQAALPKRAWNWMSLIVDIQGWGYDPNLPMHFAPYYSSPLSDGSVCKMYLTGFHHYTGDNQPSSISTATSVYFGGMNYDETMALIRDSTINSVELRLTDIDTGASISYRRNQQQPLFDSNAPDDADGNYRAHGLKLTTDADGATPHVDIPGAGGVHLTDGIVYDPTTRRFTNKPGYRGRVLWTLLVDAFAPHAYP